MKRRKQFALAVIIVLIGVVAICFIRFRGDNPITKSVSSVVDPASNSEKYIDNIYKFEISLPKEWVYKPSYGFIGGKVVPGDSVSASSPNGLRMEILISTDNRSNLIELSNEKSAMTGKGPEKVVYQMINGYKFANVIWGGKNDSEVYEVIDSHNWRFSIRFYSNENINNYKENIDQILSTFKFVE